MKKIIIIALLGLISPQFIGLEAMVVDENDSMAIMQLHLFKSDIELLIEGVSTLDSTAAAVRWIQPFRAHLERIIQDLQPAPTDEMKEQFQALSDRIDTIQEYVVNYLDGLTNGQLGLMSEYDLYPPQIQEQIDDEVVISSEILEAFGTLQLTPQQLSIACAIQKRLNAILKISFVRQLQGMEDMVNHIETSARAVEMLIPTLNRLADLKDYYRTTDSGIHFARLGKALEYRIMQVQSNAIKRLEEWTTDLIDDLPLFYQKTPDEQQAYIIDVNRCNNIHNALVMVRRSFAPGERQRITTAQNTINVIREVLTGA